MVSDFRKQKYMHVFDSFFDSDKNGTIDKKDFMLANAKFAKLRGYSPGDVTYELMKDLLAQIWAGLVAQADYHGEGYVTDVAWVDLWDDYSEDPADVNEWQQLYCKCVFQLLDATSDGSIDGDEYVAVFESFGFDKEKCQEAFQKMSQGKGSISWEDFEELWKQFFCSESADDPGNFIFGPLSFDSCKTL